MLHRIVDADQHVIEPPDFWTSRMPQRFQEVAPRVVDYPRGGQAWSFNGGEWFRPFGLEAAAGRAPADLDTWGNSFENMNPACYDPTARLGDMDIDGIDVAFLYPSAARNISSTQDDELYLELFRAYNDALWDWAQEGDPARLIPVAYMPAIGVESAMQELERCAGKGYRTYVFNDWPGGARFPTAADEPFWSLVEELGMVISLHGPGAGRTVAAVGAMTGSASTKAEDTSQVYTNDNRANALGIWKRLGMFAMTGILERHPRLRLNLVETGAGWLPFVEEQLDRTYTHQRSLGQNQLRKMPSEVIRAQVRACIQLDGAAITYRHLIGVDRIQFSTDYPHATCDWPNSRQWSHFIMKGVPEEEKDRILSRNALEWYGLC